MKQIEDKKKAAEAVKAKERSEFNRVGISASDKYYINEDAKKMRAANMKGTGRSVAENLR